MHIPHRNCFNDYVNSLISTYCKELRNTNTRTSVANSLKGFIAAEFLYGTKTFDEYEHTLRKISTFAKYYGPRR